MKIFSNFISSVISFNLVKIMAMLHGAETTVACDISHMRKPYLNKPSVLKEDEIRKDPFQMFKEWFDLACNCSQILEPNAMCLATATRDGFPSARYILLKGFSSDGFVFFTNYNSRKGMELSENPNAAVVFFWEPLKKSVRIEGTVTKIPENQSDKYFNSRPKESQISAVVSNQSSVIVSRDALEAERKKLTEAYESSQIPRPKHWGGFIIAPKRIEFWQGQSDRLHDRVIFRKAEKHDKIDNVLTHAAESGWIYERLSP